MSKAARSDAPVVQPAPWNAPALPEFSSEGKAQVTDTKSGAVEPFEPIVDTDRPGWKPEPQQSVFNPEVPRKSVFAPAPKAPAPEGPKVYPLGEDDPTWLQLVNFCQKHGKDIIQARYPHPRGECVDTIYRGVTVFAHETTQVRHIKHGWIDWKDAIY
jgi:hypothetical protein